MHVQKVTRQKRHHFKVTSGCLTCRNRRVKCDEEKPRCRRCIRLNRLCRGQGYGDDDDNDDGNALSVRLTEQAICQDPEVRECEALVSKFQPAESLSAKRVQPFSITRIQCGGSDPFDSICVPNPTWEAFDFLNHFASQIWTVFGSSNGKQDFQSLQQDAMRNACANEAVWNTFTFAGASHQAFLRSSADINPDSGLDPVRLTLKQNAISALIDATKSALEKDEINDWFLSALLTMASHGLGDTVRRESLAAVQSQKPQISISCAEYYDALEITPEHRDAFFNLLQKRGGIHAIGNVALRNAVIRFGIYTSYRLLEVPRFGRVESLENLFTCSEIIPSPRTVATSLPGLACAFFELFHRVDPGLENSTLMQIIQALAIVSRNQRLILSIESRRETSNIHDLLNHGGKGDQESTHDLSLLGACKMNLIWHRCIVMWELLSLDDRSQGLLHNTRVEETVLVYELCRIACLMYFQMWIWVIASPRINMARQLFSKILPLLAASLRPNTTTGLALYQNHPQFFLWIITLSFVMAYEDHDQTGDATTTRAILPYLRKLPVKPRPDAWSVIAVTLENFLWSNKDCDAIGRDAWEHVCSFA